MTKKKRAAPVVTAKGEGELAQQIIEIAEQSGVEVTEDPLLAETLSMIEINEEIPEALFHAIAVILAWVYRINGKTPWD
jgi:flagellar biosynthesis protein